MLVATAVAVIVARGLPEDRGSDEAGPGIETPVDGAIRAVSPSRD